MYVHAGGNSPQEYAQKWLHVKEQGWTGCKAAFITTDGDVIDPVRSVSEGIANLKAVRQAVGEDFKICIDLHGKTTPTMASRFLHAAPSSTARISSKKPRRSKTSTNWRTCARKRAFRWRPASGCSPSTASTQICQRHLVDYIQPDVVHCGGILEMKKIATIAEAYRIELAPHNPQSEVSTLASLHVDFSTPNFGIQEITHRRNEDSGTTSSTAARRASRTATRCRRTAPGSASISTKSSPPQRRISR